MEEEITLKNEIDNNNTNDKKNNIISLLNIYVAPQNIFAYIYDICSFIDNRKKP